MSFIVCPLHQAVLTFSDLRLSSQLPVPPLPLLFPPMPLLLPQHLLSPNPTPLSQSQVTNFKSMLTLLISVLLLSLHLSLSLASSFFSVLLSFPNHHFTHSFKSASSNLLYFPLHLIVPVLPLCFPQALRGRGWNRTPPRFVATSPLSLCWVVLTSMPSVTPWLRPLLPPFHTPHPLAPLPFPPLLSSPLLTLSSLSLLLLLLLRSAPVSQVHQPTNQTITNYLILFDVWKCLCLCLCLCLQQNNYTFPPFLQKSLMMWISCFCSL